MVGTFASTGASMGGSVGGAGTVRDRDPSPAGSPGEPELCGRSPAMARLLADLDAVAASEAPVVLFGESGTGKELVARTLHLRSRRARGPWVPVNCAAFPETLLEDELFGHERGAFTGAIKRRSGRFLSAHGGTLFLDEIGEMPLAGQAKLLRVLQEGTFEPVGSDRPVHVDVRIVSATHRDLRHLMAEGRFRDDLYYRLKVIGLEVPPLRYRAEDLPFLVEGFLREHAGGRRASRLTRRAWDAIRAWPFPGNVRELKHAIEHAVVLARGGEIDLEHLPDEIASGGVSARSGAAAAPAPPEAPPSTLAHALAGAEREHIVRVLRHCASNRTRAAEVLGVSRKTLWQKMRAHGIEPVEFAAAPARVAPRWRIDPTVE